MTWTCNDTRSSIRRQGSMPDGACEHLVGCELCQQLAEVDAELSPGPERRVSSLDLEDLLAATQYQLAHERGVLAWLRSRPLGIQVVLGFSVALAPVVLQWVWARRGDYRELPVTQLLAFAVAYCLVIALTLRVLLSPLYRPKSHAITWLTALVAFALPLGFVLGGPSPALTAGTSSVPWLSTLKPAMSCLRYGALLACPSVALLFAMDRTQVRGPSFIWSAAALGGAIGNFVLLIHCGNREPGHQLLGHVTVGLVLLLVFGVTLKLGALEQRRNAPKGTR